jgi:hypothetical protein
VKERYKESCSVTQDATRFLKSTRRFGQSNRHNNHQQVTKVVKQALKVNKGQNWVAGASF